MVETGMTARVDDLVEYERNAKIHTPEQIAQICESIRQFGFLDPIGVGAGNIIVEGHGRLYAARKLGMDVVPIIDLSHLTPGQQQAYILAHNKLTMNTGFDDIRYAEELAQIMIELPDLDVTALGIYDAAMQAEIEQAASVAAGGGNDHADEVPEPPQKIRSQRGDIWMLDEHRVMCGDSTERTNVDALMGGGSAVMLFTDPPWNVGIGLDSNPKHRQRKGLDNDNLSPKDFSLFLRSFIKAWSGTITGDFYCVLGASEWPTLDLAFRSLGYHWSATIIWVKDLFVLGRSKYHRRYEPIWYGWHKTGKSSFCERRDLDDVWEIPRPKVSVEHPTMKPVAVPLRAIENSSKKGDRVIDCFLGSGSTLIAAEKSGRICYGMELAPQYVDVIVKRWQDFTGKKAVHAATGKTFDETPER